MAADQLHFPLDLNSISVLEEAVDTFLPDKIFDLTWRKTFHWLTLFESIDGFTATGAPTVNGVQLDLTTTNVANNVQGLVKQPSWQGLVTFSQQSNFRTAYVLTSVSNMELYVTVGDPTGVNDYYGFKISGGNLLGVSSNPTAGETTVTLATATTSFTNIEARYIPLSGVRFIVNNVASGAISNPTKLPTAKSTVLTVLMTLRLKTLDNVAKTADFSFFEYLQNRNVAQ